MPQLVETTHKFLQDAVSTGAASDVAATAQAVTACARRTDRTSAQLAQKKRKNVYHGTEAR